MKFLVAVCVFVFTLGLTIQSIAHEAEEACAANGTEKCADNSKVKLAKTSHAEATEGTKLSTEMNSLFPEKQQNAKLTEQPPVVELIGPKFLSKISGPAKLQWKESQGANAYHVQIATDPNFKWLVAEDHFVKTNSFEFTKPEAGHKYFWRVAAFNAENNAMYSKSNFVGSVFIAE